MVVEPLKAASGHMRFAVAVLVLGALVVPAVATANPEPNENAAQAVGPLSGGTVYQGRLETAKDEDWFFFNAFGGRKLDVAGTNLTSEEATCEVPNFHLRDSSGGSISTMAPPLESTDHMTYTPPRAEKLFVQVEGLRCDPDGGPPVTYQLRVDPADAVVAPPPGSGRGGEQSPGCQAAKGRRDKLKRTLRRLRRQLKSAESRPAKRRYRRLIRKRTRQLRAARRQVSQRCASS